MPIAIICDDTISMLMKYSDEERIIDIAATFLQKFLSSMESPFLHYISMYRRNDQMGTLISFRKDYKLLIEQFREIATNIRIQIHGDFKFIEAVKYCDEELKKLWGSDFPNLIVILTDGGKAFSGLKDDTDQYSLDEKFRSIIHIISFGHNINEGLKSLCEQTGGVSLCTKPDWKDNITSNEVVERLWKAFKSQAVHFWDTESSINFGHFKTKAKLFPFVDLYYGNDKKYCYECNDNIDPRNLVIDIYGYLALADLNYPCSMSDHFFVHDASETSDEDNSGSTCFLQLLNTGLLSTKTAAICCLRYKNGSYVRYAFLRNFTAGENKYSLRLCLFPKDYSGLPWIGKFSDLGPRIDFPDLYSVTEPKSLFPVKIIGDCSYKTATDDLYQYTTWVSSPGSLVTDVSKIVRLCKRLPDRRLVFYREVNRLRETALTIGSRGLLAQLCLLLQRESAAVTSNLEAQAVIRYVVESLTNSPHAPLIDPK